MAQMYKVFTNSKCIYFVSKNNFSINNLDNCKIISPKSNKELLKNISQFSTTTGLKNLVVVFENVKKLEIAISSTFKIIEAAGGLVKNNSGNLLLIFRNGKWDLPKGKLEENEKIKDAALREVKEECGINSLKIVKNIAITFHLYTLNRQLVLKKTHWFTMKSDKKNNLKPQREEGITKVKWMNKVEIKKAMKKSYPLIQDLLSEQN
ncbi:MAG TPA: NUDIX domain-containing protein [Bacteroidia bacterium]|nr:NUDIX domain-containing protein [Bacteroidia bacterium]